MHCIFLTFIHSALIPKKQACWWYNTQGNDAAATPLLVKEKYLVLRKDRLGRKQCWLKSSAVMYNFWQNYLAFSSYESFERKNKMIAKFQGFCKSIWFQFIAALSHVKIIACLIKTGASYFAINNCSSRKVQKSWLSSLYQDLPNTNCECRNYL